VLDATKGELKDDGKFQVQVRGLLLPGASACGFDCNPAPFLRAIVSCLTIDNGVVVDDNISTTNGAEVIMGDPTKGDAKIEARLELPDPCVAPVVFLTSPTGAWFAVTGPGTIQQRPVGTTRRCLRCRARPRGAASLCRTLPQAPGQPLRFW
jgi:hypothetical protein